MRCENENPSPTKINSLPMRLKVNLSKVKAKKMFIKINNPHPNSW
jgi:hypothetical protein